MKLLKSCLMVLPLTIALFFGGCSSQKEVGLVTVHKENIQPRKYASIFIVTLTLDPEARVAVENSVANIATARGLRAVKSSDAINIDLKNPRLVTREEVIAKTKETNCEGVYVVSLVRKEESVGYTASTTTAAPATYVSFNGYYTDKQQRISGSDYYTVDRTYVLETRFFDVASEKLVWSAESKLFSPPTIKTFCTDYTNTLIKQLKKEKVIK